MTGAGKADSEKRSTLSSSLGHAAGAGERPPRGLRRPTAWCEARRPEPRGLRRRRRGAFSGRRRLIPEARHLPGGVHRRRIPSSAQQVSSRSTRRGTDQRRTARRRSPGQREHRRKVHRPDRGRGDMCTDPQGARAAIDPAIVSVDGSPRRPGTRREDEDQERDRQEIASTSSSPTVGLSESDHIPGAPVRSTCTPPGESCERAFQPRGRAHHVVGGAHHPLRSRRCARSARSTRPPAASRPS